MPSKSEVNRKNNKYGMISKVIQNELFVVYVAFLKSSRGSVIIRFSSEIVSCLWGVACNLNDELVV